MEYVHTCKTIKSSSQVIYSLKIIILARMKSLNIQYTTQGLCETK